jgi:hypothetical protein
VKHLDLMLAQGYTVRARKLRGGKVLAYVDSPGTPLRGLPQASIEAALWSLDENVGRQRAIEAADKAGDHETWMRLLNEASEERKAQAAREAGEER